VERLGIDVKRLTHDLDSGSFREQVQSDAADGKRRNFRGVPTVFVYGERFDGIPSAQEWRALYAAAVSASLER